MGDIFDRELYEQGWTPLDDLRETPGRLLSIGTASFLRGFITGVSLTLIVLVI